MQEHDKPNPNLPTEEIPILFFGKDVRPFEKLTTLPQKGAPVGFRFDFNGTQAMLYADYVNLSRSEKPDYHPAVYIAFDITNIRQVELLRNYTAKLKSGDGEEHDLDFSYYSRFSNSEDFKKFIEKDRKKHGKLDLTSTVRSINANDFTLLDLQNMTMQITKKEASQKIKPQMTITQVA